MAAPELGVDRCSSLAIGALNLYVAYNFAESVWVNFKLFGLIGPDARVRAGAGFWLASKMQRRKASERRRSNAAGTEPRWSASASQLAQTLARRRARTDRRQSPACRPCRRARRPRAFPRADRFRRLRRAAPAAASPARVSFAGRADADRYPCPEHYGTDTRRSGARRRPATPAAEKRTRQPRTRNRQDCRDSNTYISNTRALMTHFRLTRRSCSPCLPRCAARRLQQGRHAGAGGAAPSASRPSTASRCRSPNSTCTSRT